MSQDFPSLNAYLRRLPNGLASFPQVTAKGSILRSVLANAPQELPLGVGLPREVEAFVKDPPAASSWTLGVELWATSLAIYDVVFRDAGGLAAYGEWSERMNAALLQSPLYRIIFAVVSPERLFVSLAQRFAAFHRGMEVHDPEATKGRGTFSITMPPYELPELGLVGLSSGFRAALKIAGAKDVRIHGDLGSPTRATFEATWRA